MGDRAVEKKGDIKEFVVKIDTNIREKENKTIEELIEILKDKYSLTEFEKFSKITEELMKFKIREGQTDESSWKDLLKFEESVLS